MYIVLERAWWKGVKAARKQRMLVLPPPHRFLHFIQRGTSARGMVLLTFRLHYSALVPLSGDNFTDKPRCACQLFKLTVKISHGESIESSVGRDTVAGRSRLGSLNYISVEQEADTTLSAPSFVLCHSGLLGSHQNNTLSLALK